ncbi:MAG: hypothetical protein M1132_10960 [Chloroflexi bacterium]|nr:hypothetical protein [Chloroflexota bacterium]
MPDTADHDARLSEHIRAAKNTDEIRAILGELGSLQDRGELSFRERCDIQVSAFEAAQQLTINQPDVAESIIVEDLLPFCVMDSSDANIALHQHREILADWLYQYSETGVGKIRRRVLAALVERLRENPTLGSCWTVSHIGYREDAVVEALWDVVSRQDNELGDTALATLCELGVSSEQQTAILLQLQDRISKRYSRALTSAVAHMGDRTSADLAISRWLEPQRQDFDPMDISLVLGALRDTLDRRDEDSDLQDHVWRQLMILVRKRPEEFPHYLYLGQIATVCNSALMVPGMMDLLALEIPSKPNSAWSRRLIELRLRESVRPNQLEGWKNAIVPSAFDLIHEDATRNTGTDLFARTEQMYVKEQAWETALRAGHKDALAWLEDAIVVETSRFLQQEIIDSAACLSIQPLPHFAKQWIIESFDETQPEKDSREFTRRMAAVRLARSNATREAFDSLLHFGIRFKGTVLQESADALTDVATHLVSIGDTTIVPELVQTLMASPISGHRLAAANALNRIASRNQELVAPHAHDLLALLFDAKRDAFEVGSIIGTLGKISNWPIPDDAVLLLEKWSLESDRWLGGNSLETLARHRLLPDRPYLLTNALGLQQIGETWDLIPNASRPEWAAYIIGLLYHYDSAKFSPAISSLLALPDLGSAVQTMAWLVRQGDSDDPRQLPANIRDSLLGRIRNRQSSSYAETDIFAVLAQVAPQALVTEPWEDIWNQWMPDSRVAIADALGTIALAPNERKLVVHKLQILCGDGQYAVRRAAYRSFAKQGRESLYSLCLAWSGAPSTELRKRAAEATGWLLADDAGTDVSKRMNESLAIDPEVSVRETARRSWEERRKRSWADKYLSLITRTEAWTNEQVLSMWRYADAMSQIGDDSCIQALSDYLHRGSFPLHVSYWLQQTVRQMSKNWRETTRKWPNPWMAWEGSVEEGEGRLSSQNGTILEVTYSAWHQPASDLLEKTSWGGSVRATSIPIPAGSGLIELSDGRKGRILVTSSTVTTSTTGMATFVGVGPYPNKDSY